MDPVAALQAISRSPPSGAAEWPCGTAVSWRWRCSARTWTPARSWSARARPRVWTRTPRRCSPWDEVLADLAAGPRPAWPTGWTWPPVPPLLNALPHAGAGWRGTIPRLVAIDLQYADVRPGRGSTTSWCGLREVRTLVSAEQIEAAATPHRGHPRVSAARGGALPGGRGGRRLDTVDVTFPASGAVRGSRCPNPGTSPVT
ncbi:proteasome accessory factor PafA2 family protein [Kocuria rhizophila]|nr:proteasome accessory factor PafA2 family protein [Kocuria rhizophila]